MSGPVTWLHDLPGARPCRREPLLLEQCRGSHVIHVGFVDEPLLERRLDDGSWLHALIADVASRLVGIDISPTGVDWARAHGFEAHLADVQRAADVAALGLERADVVVAGEVIEHLGAPGPFLEAMHLLVRPGGLLVVTTPNAYRVLNFVAPLSGRELVHPDHTAWHSPNTLRTLLQRSGWSIEDLRYYQNPPDPVDRADVLSRRLAQHVANGLRRTVAAVGVVAPYWSDGLVAVCRRHAASSPA